MTIPAGAISVIIPAYDAAPFLAETLESVHDQTRPVDEIVVVDDGSNDDTAAVAWSHNARVVRHEKNRGVSAARNSGIRAARNAWIAFLDADDHWKPDKIERQYSVVEQHPGVRLVFTDEEHRQHGNLVRSSFLREHEHYPRVEKTPLGDDVFRLDGPSAGRGLFPGNFIKPSTMLVHRELLEEAGTFDERFTAPDSEIGTCEDQELAMRLTMHTDPVVIEDPLVVYRIRDGSVSSDTVGLKLGFVYLADKVMANPERYPEGADEYLRNRKPVALRQAAVTCMHAGTFEKAESLLRRSLRSRITWRAFVALSVCLMGEEAFHALRAVKRWFRLPGIG